MRRSIRTHVSECLRDRTGNFAILTAVAMLPIAVGASLVIDLGIAYLEAERMQSALDSAALSAVKTYGESGDEQEALKQATVVFKQNFQIPENASQFGIAENAEAITLVFSQTAFELTAEARYSFDYNPVFLKRIPFEISRRSVAGRLPGTQACIIALHPTAYRGFEVSGSANVDMSGCTINANSNSEQAIYVSGSGNLKAECLFATGGIHVEQNAVELACTSARERAPRVPDPFKNKQLPSVSSPIDVSGCGQNFIGGGGGGGNCNGTGRTPNGNTTGYVVTLKPGTYNALDLKGAVDLELGSYVIDGGSLQLGSQAVVTGKNVTFFLLNGANLSINGGATFDISPSLAGPWAGFSVVADHGNQAPAIINGNSTSRLSGIVYVPDAQEIQYSGNGTTSGECIRLIAQEITLTGNSSFKMDCNPELANTKINNPGATRLVQ